jgi:hypothetical protein
MIDFWGRPNNMINDFDKILDECIDRINHGEGIDSILADYPDHAAQLRPLLQATLTAREAYSFVPSPGTKRAARERFNAALEVLERRREERQARFAWFFGRSRVWATAATVILIAVIGLIVMRPVLFPVETIPEPGQVTVTPGTQPGPDAVSPGTQPGTKPGVTIPQPNPEGNFVFLISDDVNAIGDFESVKISISEISLLKSGDSDQQIEFKPEQGEVDLTLVQGDKTQEIWRGNVPNGEYKNVTIEVADVHGILKETGEEVEIKLPSQKLHVSKRFQVSTDKLTTFTYDLTVVAAGSPHSGIKYILKPQVDQSSAEQKPIEPKEKGKKEDSNRKKP